MTIMHSGSSRKFADNWQKIFTGRSKANTAKTAAKSSAKTVTKKKASATSGALKKSASAKRSAARSGKR